MVSPFRPASAIPINGILRATAPLNRMTSPARTSTSQEPSRHARRFLPFFAFRGRGRRGFALTSAGVACGELAEAVGVGAGLMGGSGKPLVRRNGVVDGDTWAAGLGVPGCDGACRTGPSPPSQASADTTTTAGSSAVRRYRASDFRFIATPAQPSIGTVSAAGSALIDHARDIRGLSRAGRISQSRVPWTRVGGNSAAMPPSRHRRGRPEFSPHIRES